MIILGHGFCSSGLFFAANTLFLRSLSRNFMILKGFQLILPSLGLGWFVLTAANMAAPPSLNFFGEIGSLVALLGWNLFLRLPLGVIIFLAGFYSLVLYIKTQHGFLTDNSASFRSASVKEVLVLRLHWVPLNLLFLK